MTFIDKLVDITQPRDPESLVLRFGTARHYEDVIHNIQSFNVKETFKRLEQAKYRMDERYERARQIFLKLLGQHRYRWHATSPTTDLYVDITRIHQDNKDEYIGFMRIQPNGFRGERQVPENMKLHFHLLIGQATVTNRRRSKVMVRGSHAVIQPKGVFSLRCGSHDQSAVFVFRILRNKTQIVTDRHKGGSIVQIPSY